MGHDHRKRKLIALLLLAPTIPELLTGSTPLWELANPLNLLILVILYGFPALILREYVHRRGLGYHSLMFLGMLEGVLVEGLAVNTFYSDSQAKLGLFSSYGRIMGVNWNWALYLTFFHSIYSVLVPVMLVDSIYSDESLTGEMPLRYMMAAVVGITLLFNLSEDTYRPPFPYYILSLGMFLLIILLFRLQDDRSVIWERLRFPTGRLYLFAPLFLIVAFFGLAGHIHPLLHATVGVLLYASLYNALRSIHTGWRQSRDLLVGLAITGLIVALLSGRYYIVPSAIAFLIIAAYWERNRRNAASPTSSRYPYSTNT